MSFEGVWQVEMMGPYGWEKIATAFLHKGEYLSAGADHYSVGTYEEDGDKITVDVKIKQHGKTRTIFGETKKQVEARIDGKLKKSGKITGMSHPAENRNFEVKVRLTRLEKLD